jgi:predicted secreted protein
MQGSKILAWFLCSAILVIAETSGADADRPKDEVSFQVEVGQDVENDRVVAAMNVTAENEDPAQLADSINATMQWALDQVRGNDKVKARSGSYQTYPVYDEKKIVRWRGHQELQLESPDVDQLSQLIGVLQGRLQMRSLQFSVSPGKRQQVENQLIEQALKAFQGRAGIVQKALGAESYRLLDVSIHTGGQDRVVPMRMEATTMLRQSAVSKPAMEQGTSRVTVQVSGKIRLLRD